MTSAGTAASVGTGPTNVGPRAWEAAEEEDAPLQGTATARIDGMEAEDSLTTMTEEKIEVTEADLAATTATTVITSEETTGTVLDLQDAITTIEESLVIVTREADPNAETSEITEEIDMVTEMEIDKREDAVEVPVDLIPEALKTEREVAEKAAATEKTMVVPHSSNRVFVSTAIRKVTRRSRALSTVAPEKEEWTEGEIIESIALEEAVAEAETAEATLLDSSPGADLPAPHTKAEKTEKPPIKIEKDSPEKNRASITVNKRKEGTEVLLAGPDPPKEDATSRTATIENECD